MSSDSDAVSLRPIEAADQPVIERLWQLYAHDLSQSRGSLPNAEGLFKLGHLEWFRSEPNIWKGFLVTFGDAPVGFAYVGVRWEGARNSIGDFFIVRALRRRGVGEHVARELILRYPGEWEIAFQDHNPGAPEFWKRVVSNIVGDIWRDEWRPVPNKPDIPPDHWLIFSVAG